MVFIHNGKVVIASSKKEVLASKWTEKELEELGINKKELKKISDTLKKETFEVS